MPSLKSRLVALVLRHTRKRAFLSAAEMNRWIARARRFETHVPPAALQRRMSIVEREVAGHPVYEVRPLNGAAARRIVYFHGGAYVFEITTYHWRLIADMAERLGVQVTVPIYPIAPEHTFEAIFGMALETWRSVLDEPPASEVAFMGDSAGGNMAVVLAMMAARQGLPTPARMVLISPGLDMTMENPALAEAARLDPWLDIEGGLEAIRHYAPDIDRADWRISPIKGDLSILPPTLILAGECDLLTLDTIRFAALASAAGVEIDLHVEPDMIHVWPLIDMPEARRARDRMASWLRRQGFSAHPSKPVRAAGWRADWLSWRPRWRAHAQSGLPPASTSPSS